MNLKTLRVKQNSVKFTIHFIFKHPTYGAHLQLHTFYIVWPLVEGCLILVEGCLILNHTTK